MVATPSANGATVEHADEELLGRLAIHVAGCHDTCEVAVAMFDVVLEAPQGAVASSDERWMGIDEVQDVQVPDAAAEEVPNVAR